MAEGSFIPASAMRAWPRLSASARSVAAVLGWAIRERKESLPKREIARLCGYARTETVRRGLRELRARGLVAAQPARGGASSYRWASLSESERLWLEAPRGPAASGPRAGRRNRPRAGESEKKSLEKPTAFLEGGASPGNGEGASPGNGEGASPGNGEGASPGNGEGASSGNGAAPPRERRGAYIVNKELKERLKETGTPSERKGTDASAERYDRVVIRL